MKIPLNFLTVFFLTLPYVANSAEVVSVSPTGGILKMVLGLTVVLALMAFITWVLKRMIPGANNKQSVVRVVGSVNVGSRERVVVVEVAGRWLVVGVASGQVNGIANLEIGSMKISENEICGNNTMNSVSTVFTQSFAQWLKKSTAKITENSDAKE